MVGSTRDSDLPPPSLSSSSSNNIGPSIPTPIPPQPAQGADVSSTPTTSTIPTGSDTTGTGSKPKSRSAQSAQTTTKSKSKQSSSGSVLNNNNDTGSVSASLSPRTDSHPSASASVSTTTKRKSQQRRQSSTAATTAAPPTAAPPTTTTFHAHPISPPAPVYHHPSLPPHSRMNPPFPVNGSPYPHPPPPPPPASYHPQHPPHNGVAHHSPAPYGYHPMQHYPPHQYHPYPGYSHHPMMAYPAHAPPPPPHAHPPPQQPSQSASPPAPASVSGSKRKRKGTADSGKKGPERMSDAEDTEVHKKRTKTQRACDSCRSRKIRCDILPDTDPPKCQHCKQYSFDCTFFLPITETRFKKKRQEEEAAAAVAAAEKEKGAESEAKDSPKPEGTRGVRIDGPTSMTHLLHSTSTVPSRAYQSYDLRYHHTWEVGKTGDGLIQVLEPTTDDSQVSLSKSIDPPVERDVVEKLINSYFTDVAPLVPIVTQAEFLALSDPSPPPILLYSICLVAACKRDVSQEVFDALRVAVNDLIKSEDVLCTASIVNVQSLLILCQCGDCHSPFVPTALSSLWIRLGTAIRMAQDLGLHRAEAVKKNIEMRRRVWGACVITDRWTSLSYGHPYMIDVEDCDARLPSSGDPNDHYTDELLRLSLILGRVLKTIYSPSGLKHATDEKLHELLADMKAWKENLPEDLQFRGPTTPRSGGLLHLLYACVCMIFWRVFMRISYSCPAHLKFGLTIEAWTELVKMTGEAIDWLDEHEELYDAWMLVAYAATSCALVQYHTWVRRKDIAAQEKLRKLRDCVRRWEKSLQPEHMSTRRKTAEIITLLYETTQGPPVNIDEPAALNPTGGVRNKQPSSYQGLKYRKDPSRPGGGVFVASGKAAKDGDYSGIPEGVIIVHSDEESTEGEEQAAEVSIVQQTNDPASSSSPFARESAPAASAAVAASSPTVAGSQTTGRGMMMSTTTTFAVDAAGARVKPEQHEVTNTMYNPSGSANQQGENLGTGYMNVNPSLNVVGMMNTDVRVMNVLDVPPAPNMLEQFAAADSGLLEGLPGSMFDWPQWETFFSTRLPAPDANALALLQSAQATQPLNGGSHQNSNQPPSQQMMYPEGGS